MAPPHRSTLAFDCSTEERARVLERALRREVGEIDSDRSGASVTREGATLRVEVVGEDLVGLRAGLNTWLGLVGAAEDAADAAAAARS